MPGRDEQSILLASSSATRARLLRAAGLAVEAVSPPVDEAVEKRVLRAAGTRSAALATALAERKAAAVAAIFPRRQVLGCDQVLLFGDRVFDKPADRAEAERQLRALRGGWHSLVSAACLIAEGVPRWRGAETARLRMRDFSDAFLADYLDRIGEAALAGPGAYRVEELGIQLFTELSGTQPCMLGLPLLSLLAHLRACGRLAS